MTKAQAQAKFLEAPIVVQFGQDPNSQRVRSFVAQELGCIPGIKLEYAELEGPSSLGVRIFHMGDVIAGPRVKDFVSYVLWLSGTQG